MVVFQLLLLFIINVEYFSIFFHSIAQSDANIQGLTACYYKGTNGNAYLYNEDWYAENVAETCAILETLDVSDNFGEDDEHIIEIFKNLQKITKKLL